MKLLLLSASATRRTALMLALVGVFAAPVVVWQAQQGAAGGPIGGTNTSAVTGSGSSSGHGKGGGNSGNGGGNGGGPVTPPPKTFQISGAVNDLAPAVTRQLVLTVTNPNNQAIRVTSLSATVVSITKAVGAPAGACSPTSLLQVGAWTGSAFNVSAGQTRTITGHIPLTLSNAAGDGCQGATFRLNYTGSAAQL